MGLFRRTAMAALAGLAALAAVTAPATAATTAAQDGWVRIAHLSPQAPAMDMYLYPFGDPAHPVILRDVGYGHVSGYMALGPGQYTVAMRGFGAPASSAPALATSFMVSAGTAYTVAALGPDPGLRVEVLRDRMTAPAGQAVVRVLQASLRQHQVTVGYGPQVLARQLAFGRATPYTAVPPGTRTVRFTAPGQQAAAPVTLAAGSVHTIVALDGPSGLRVDALTDAAGSRVVPKNGTVPKGGAATGLGGTSPRPGGDPAPWLGLIGGGALLAAAAAARLTTRRWRPGGR